MGWYVSPIIWVVERIVSQGPWVETHAYQLWSLRDQEKGTRVA